MNTFFINVYQHSLCTYKHQELLIKLFLF